MPDANDRLTEDLAGGAIELIPGVGPLLAPLAKRAFKSIREEWARNSSKALRAAERISGMSREELSDRISDDPRLIPLVTRVLYAAGMTGQDTILRALGTALGDAGSAIGMARTHSQDVLRHADRLSLHPQFLHDSVRRPTLDFRPPSRNIQSYRPVPCRDWSFV